MEKECGINSHSFRRMDTAEIHPSLSRGREYFYCSGECLCLIGITPKLPSNL